MGKKKLVETRCSPCYINNLFTHLEQHHERAKLDEIEAIGFSFLRRVPQWHVKQSIMLQLARAYDVDTNTLMVDAGNICISAELIGSVFGIPSHGEPIPELEKKNPSHLAIKAEFQKKTTSQFREFVFACPMETEQQRMRFRRYFIMVVLKMFLNPTSQQIISPWHLPPILDVSNPRRFHWPYHILKWLRDAIRKFQDENRETCGGCMFVLLVLYFQRLKHGPLHACRVPEPWIVEWTTNELDKKADYVISQGCIITNVRTKRKQRKQCSSKAVNEGERCKRTRNDTDESPSTKGKTSPHPTYRNTEKCCLVNNSMKRHKKQPSCKAVNKKGGCRRPCKDTDQFSSTEGKTTSQPRYKETDKQSKTGTRRKVILSRNRSRRRIRKEIPKESVSGSTAAPLVVSESDDDDHVPLARRIREFDISIVQCPEFEQVLNNVEQGHQTKAIIMQPLQTVFPKGSPYHTPSLGRPSFSLGLTQLEKTPTPSPIHSIHPRLREIKLGETKEEQIRSWIVNPSLDKNQDLASYEGRGYMVLQRKDFWTLKPRSWVNSCVIQWMCYSFNDTQSSRFKREFYCVCPGILESVIKNDSLKAFMDGVEPIYDGLSPSFGDDTRFFDKVEAAKRKWWLIPYCWRGHWWVYAFDVVAKRLLILDSLHYGPEDDKRINLDAYMGRLCEDMASISIPAFVRTTHGPARSYARVPKQPNNFDCGMCVIKLMDSWTEERQLCEWDEDSLQSDRMELMLDIICGPHNTLVHQLISLLEQKVIPVRRNEPRNKKKDVRSPYTAPSTRSLIERAEGLPKGAMHRGRKKLLA
ncbi:hypothetical protein Ahy_A10g050492 [Arachis hypogaea]|uniref:Ubiquitin-like protease family profile domain-containing protein n=1 Tax=Arachis hypogaea TaxID=3818 RepID=A0A445B9G5_ARAHY|nr:hypothetical protein Ahy_A10g050492 [Arachis hypogaea]